MVKQRFAWAETWIKRSQMGKYTGECSKGRGKASAKGPEVRTKFDFFKEMNLVRSKCGAW